MHLRSGRIVRSAQGVDRYRQSRQGDRLPRREVHLVVLQLPAGDAGQVGGAGVPPLPHRLPQLPQEAGASAVASACTASQLCKVCKT